MKFKLVEKIIVSSSEATRSRELQVIKAFFHKQFSTLLELTVYFFLNLSLLGQSIELEQNFHYIKDLIDRKQVKEAQRQIDILRSQNENDPTLELYQTEVWIQIGEKNYRESNLKTAFENFKKAYEVYPSNPLVNSRYKELSGKVLFDSSMNTSSTEGKSKVALSLFPIGLQGGGDVIPENHSGSSGLLRDLSNLEILLGVICLQNMFLILLQLRKPPKR